MEPELEKRLDLINARLDGIEGTMEEFHTLIHNHMTDYSTKFGRLKACVETSAENEKVRDEALHTKINAFKWSLVLIATFTVISLGGFIALAMWAISKLLGS